jgi:hypothetical protein
MALFNATVAAPPQAIIVTFRNPVAEGLGASTDDFSWITDANTSTGLQSTQQVATTVNPPKEYF